ncbi:uncharacterized protein LOC131611012 [Vicia villosa]|uniref:uncharacterized protein LOC131611012 n=1 Tax=Vicia villosa TaxID=3911 RepID=UPI00273AA1E9|nr:uncharacterized protein LOC131611012 [Vicia villosa]
MDTNAPPDTEAKEVARGITIMKGIIRHRDQGLVYRLEWNSENQAIGPNSAKLTSYIGTLVRMHILVSVDKWNMKSLKLDAKKKAIWDELQRTFEIPDDRRRYILSLAGKRYRGWKAFLTNTYLKDKDGNFLEEAPGRPKKYEIFIGEKDWAEFVKQRDEDFRKRSATNSARASKPAYPYKKGRLGYARLDDKILEETKSEEPSLPVHVLWKEARVGKNQAVDPDVQRVYTECETLSQSVSTSEGSVLSRALDAPEYPGRVRGKGHGVTPTSFYKSPRRRSNLTNEEVLQKLQELQAQVSELQRDKEMYMREKCNTSSVKETSDKASINCQRKFPEGISSCQLYLSAPNYRLVGKGKVHNTLGDLLHHRPLPDGHLKVSVDVVVDHDAMLSVPDMVSETTLLRDAIGSFVEWPSELITISDETAPIKPAIKGTGILQEDESVASLKEASARDSQ